VNHNHSSPSDDAIRQRSISRYRLRAADYDSTCGPTWPIRLNAIDSLELRAGDAVLDVGCGTGLSLPLLREAVGEKGRVYGFDQSPEMLTQARQRISSHGWANVKVCEVPARSLALPERVDAVLFHYTHDILRSTASIDHLLGLARPGARVAIAGICFFPWWCGPLNLWVYLKNRAYNGSPGELRAPWNLIAARLTDWRMSRTQWGMGYLASGRVPQAADRS
jgi:arsenite methyltransferase